MAKRRSDAPWRAECAAMRGEFCRACGSSKHVECDHIKSRGQGGPSVVENGLFLCGAWGSCGAHALKTAGRLRIRREWLDPDQIEWLEAVGWVRWDPVTGEVSGEGWRHFEPERATPTPEKETIVSDTDTEIPTDEEGYADPALSDDLAAAADAALEAEGSVEQPHLEGTNYARMKFVGLAWEQPERPALKDEVTLLVRGTCVGHTEEVMHDGNIRELAKIRVDSIERADRD